MPPNLQLGRFFHNIRERSPQLGLVMDVVILKDSISQHEQYQLREKAKDYRRTGVLESNEAGPRRFFRKVDGTEYCDASITAIGQRVIKTFGLEGFEIDPYLGWIISFVEPDGFIHPHLDRQPLYAETNQKHFRCNVMVSNGGTLASPIIGGRGYRVDERALWGFFASELTHGTLPNVGSGPRIVYQFGFTVPGDYSLTSYTGMFVMG